MLLCAAMLISFVPAAWAEGDGQELLAEQPVEEQVEQPAEEPYVPPVEEPSAPEEPTVTEPPVVEPTAEPEPSTEPEPTAEPEPAVEPEPEEPGFITFSGADYRDEALVYQYIVDTAAGETVTLAPAPVYDGVLAYVWLRYDAALGTYAEIDPAENPTANSPALTVTVAEGDIGAASLYACSVYAEDGAAGCAAFTFRQRAADTAGTDGVLVETITVTAPGDVNSVDVGETLQLSASVTPEDAENKAVIWTSSDEETATVDENGLVTGVADGVVTIYAAVADDSGAVGEIELIVGNGIALLAANGKVISSQDIEKAIEWGKAYLSKDASAFYGLCAAFVFDCYHSGAGLNNSSYSTATAMGNALITNTDSNPPRGAFVFWYDPNNTAGHVALSLGDGNVIHAWGTVKESCVVVSPITKVNGWYGTSNYRGWGAPISGYKLETDTSTVRVQSLSVTCSETEFYPNETLTATVEVLPSNASNKSVTWRSSDTNVATVDADGVITAVAPGTV